MVERKTRAQYQGMNDHDLLVGLCERQDGIYDHLSRLNDSVARHEKDLQEHTRKIAVLCTRQEERTGPMWFNSRPRLIGIGSLLIAAATLCSVVVAELIKSLT